MALEGAGGVYSGVVCFVSKYIQMARIVKASTVRNKT